MLEKIVKVNDRSYKVKFPNVGDFIDIRILKSQLSKGESQNLLASLIGHDMDAYLYIETYAHISILMPDLLKDLNVSSLLKLSLQDFQVLVETYTEEIYPWIKGYLDELKSTKKTNEDQ